MGLQGQICWLYQGWYGLLGWFAGLDHPIPFAMVWICCFGFAVQCLLDHTWQAGFSEVSLLGPVFLVRLAGLCFFGLVCLVCWVRFAGQDLKGNVYRWGLLDGTYFVIYAGSWGPCAWTGLLWRLFGVRFTQPGLLGQVFLVEFAVQDLLGGVCWNKFSGLRLLGWDRCVGFSVSDLVVHVCWVRFPGKGFMVWVYWYGCTGWGLGIALIWFVGISRENKKKI